VDFCNRCGAKLRPNWKFCVVCGFDLLQSKDLELSGSSEKYRNMIEKSESTSLFNQDESDLNNIRSFSHSLGTLFGQIGGYSIIQIIVSVILTFISVGMLFSAVYETSLLAIFNAFQSTIWTILIVSIILDGILYIFIIKLIRLLKGAEKQEILFRDNYRKSALFFIGGIILGVILLVVAIFVTIWILQLIQEIFNDPLFEVEDLAQIPSTDVISTLMQVGHTSLYLGGFYYLKQNFRQLSVYMRNSEKVFTGFQLLVIGYILLILGYLIGLIVDLAGVIGLVGLILIIVGYFQASNGLKNTIWNQL
jgi:hypothetical protein